MFPAFDMFQPLLVFFTNKELTTAFTARCFLTARELNGAAFVFSLYGVPRLCWCFSLTNDGMNSTVLPLYSPFYVGCTLPLLVFFTNKRLLIQ